MVKKDEQLVDELKNGSIEAFEQLYNKYSNRLYGFAIRFARGNRYQAEEIVQNVFVKVWECRNQINGHYSFISYTCTIAKNMLLNEYQHQTIINIHEAYVKTHYSIESNATQEEIEVKLLQERLSEIVEKLPPQRKKIFHLSRNHYLSNKEIAKQLNISESTVESQMNKVLAFIRRELGEYLILLCILYLTDM